MTDVTLLHGDCLDIMPTLPANSVQMVFADLPYGVLSHRDWDKKIDLKAFWGQLDAVAQLNAAKLFTCNFLLASQLVASNAKQFRYDLVWQKTYASNFLLAKKRPLCTHEHVAMFAKGATIYNPQMRPESERKSVCAVVTEIKNKKKWHVGAFSTRCVRKGPMYPTAIISTYESRKGKVHPTQKPVALLEWLIKTYTNEGDTVLDPTAGSGTTAIAAMRTGRKVICIEKDAAYYDVMCKRVADERLAGGA